jgi:hypothetical protein
MSIFSLFADSFSMLQCNYILKTNVMITFLQKKNNIYMPIYLCNLHYAIEMPLLVCFLLSERTFLCHFFIS